MEFPRRKPNRLKNHDYSSPNVYFITFCTQHMQNCLWDKSALLQMKEHPPETVHALPKLSLYGQKTQEAIMLIEVHYPAIRVLEYAIMPNHVHLLLQIMDGANEMSQKLPSVKTVVGQLKGYVTKQMGYSTWQKLFHDHVVRNKNEFEKIRHYIEDNPHKWKDDCYYKTD